MGKGVFTALHYFKAGVHCISSDHAPPPLNTIEKKKCQLWVVETQFRINGDRRVIYSKGAQLVQRTERNAKESGLLQGPQRQGMGVSTPAGPSSTSPASCLCLESSPPLEGFLQMRMWQKAAWNPSFEFPDTCIRGLSRALIQTLPKNFVGFSVHNISIYEQFEGRRGRRLSDWSLLDHMTSLSTSRGKICNQRNREKDAGSQM